MRLFEVEDRFIDDLSTELRLLRGRSDSVNATQTLSWEAFNQIVSSLNHGQLSKASLATLVKASPALNAEIKTFDDDNIILNTEEESKRAKTRTDIPPGPSVDQMAHSAASDFQSKLS